MENKTKITAFLIIMAAIVAGIYLSLPVVYAEVTPTGNGQYTINLQYRRRAWLGLNLLRNGVPETLNGDAIAVDRAVLVLEVEENQVNIILPNKWIVDGQVINRSELFDGDPLSIGESQTISLKTLKLELTRSTHTVQVFVAYEILVDGVTIKAMLPFNIQTS